MRLRLCWQQISILAPMWFHWSRRPLVWMGSSSTTPSSQLCSHMIYSNGEINKHHGWSCSTATLWWPGPFMMAWSACTHQATFIEIWKTTTFSSKILMQMVARAVSCWVISALPNRSGVRSTNLPHRITLVPPIWLPASLMAKVTLSASTPWFGSEELTSTEPLCRPKLTTALGPWWSHTSSAFPRTRISRRCLGRVVVDPWALEDASSTPERQTAGPGWTAEKKGWPFEWKMWKIRLWKTRCCMKYHGGSSPLKAYQIPSKFHRNPYVPCLNPLCSMADSCLCCATEAFHRIQRASSFGRGAAGKWGPEMGEDWGHNMSTCIKKQHNFTHHIYIYIYTHMHNMYILICVDVYIYIHICIICTY